MDIENRFFYCMPGIGIKMNKGDKGDPELFKLGLLIWSW
jgi:hypothetical protein